MAAELLYLVRCVPERLAYVDAIAEQIPDVVRSVDSRHDVMAAFSDTLARIGEQPCVMMEDDIELCSDFRAKAEAVISERPHAFISFFDLSKKRLASRWEPGRDLTMSQCLYLPAGSAALIGAFFPNAPRRAKHPTSPCFAMSDWLTSRKQHYYVHCPSLVQHLPIVSAIDSRRSRFRQSPTFVP